MEIVQLDMERRGATTVAGTVVVVASDAAAAAIPEAVIGVATALGGRRYAAGNKASSPPVGITAAWCALFRHVWNGDQVRMVQPT